MNDRLIAVFLHVLRISCFASTWVAVLASSLAAEFPVVDWIKQFGTANQEDVINSVANDHVGNVFAAGTTFGDLSPPSFGRADLLVAQFTPTGDQVWVRQWGMAQLEFGHSVTVDDARNVYLAGQLDSPTSLTINAVLAKYDSNGTQLWTRELQAGDNQRIKGVSADSSGHIFYIGETNGNLGGPFLGSFDAFFGSYDSAGNLRWIRHLGSDTIDTGQGVVADGTGNVYFTGWTGRAVVGDFGGEYDAFLLKYDSEGNSIWTRQLGGAARDQSHSVAVDGVGGVYICGRTNGLLNGEWFGDWDAFLSRYDSAGNLLWTKQFGTSAEEQCNEIAADEAGNAYVVGTTFGSLDGTNAGRSDVFTRKYDQNGNLLFGMQFGTDRIDEGNAVSWDGRGSFYVGGYTEGALVAGTTSAADAFLMKVTPIPEPSTQALAAIGVVAWVMRRWMRKPK